MLMSSAFFSMQACTAMATCALISSCFMRLTRSPKLANILGAPSFPVFWERVGPILFITVILSEATAGSEVEEPALSERSESNGTPLAARMFASACHPPLTHVRGDLLFWLSFTLLYLLRYKCSL